MGSGVGDMVALRVLEELTRQGVRVPEDAGVLGLYDFRCNRTAKRPVTTWRIDPVEIAEKACDALLERVEFPDRPPARQFVRPKLIEHGTF